MRMPQLFQVLPNGIADHDIKLVQLMFRPVRHSSAMTFALRKYHKVGPVATDHRFKYQCVSHHDGVKSVSFSESITSLHAVTHIIRIRRLQQQAVLLWTLTIR